MVQKSVEREETSCSRNEMIAKSFYFKNIFTLGSRIFEFMLLLII